MDSNRGSETILLVEDEELLRTLVTEALTLLGYRVLAAACGDEAITLAKRHSGRIDLLLTDVVMDELTGPEVAEKLCAARPETKVIYISGFPHGSLAPGGELKPGTILLQKPFTIKALSAKIREVLGSQP